MPMNKRFSQSVEATVLSPDRVGAALSVLALNIVSSRHGFNALMFFPWIAIYSALYLPRRAILAHVALIGVALALVERYSSGVSDPVATWSITFATVVVIAQIVSHLVLILRRDGTQDAL